MIDFEKIAVRAAERVQSINIVNAGNVPNSSQARSILKSVLKEISSELAVEDKAYNKVHDNLPMEPMQSTLKDMKNVYNVAERNGDTKLTNLASQAAAFIILAGLDRPF